MAVPESMALQNDINNCSVLSPSIVGNDSVDDDIRVAYSPFLLSCSAAKQSYPLSPQLVSTLTLRPAPCYPRSVTYRNGQITPTSPLLCVVKADRTPFPPPLPNTWTWSPDTRSCLASLPPTHLDEGPSNWYGSPHQPAQELLRWQLRQSRQSNPLLSPIKFSPDVEARTPDQIEQLPHPDHFDDREHQHPYDDTKSFNSSDWDLNAPSRRLSYGEPLDVLEARLACKSLRSAGLRSQAEWLAEDKSCDTWIDETLKAQTSRPYHSEPSRRKNRLWLDLVEDDEEIEEAHATVVTTSPSKPRMISIRPRRATAGSSSAIHPGVSDFLPATPPNSPNPSIETPGRPLASPDEVSMKTLDTGKQERQRQAFSSIQSRTIHSRTPPASAADTSTPCSTETVRPLVPQSPIVPLSHAISRPATPPPVLMDRGFKLSDLTTWILTELENAISGDRNQALQLDNLAIQQLRLSPNQRKIPCHSPLSPARSKFSTTRGPLSSHTSPSYFAAPPPGMSEWPSEVVNSTRAANCPTISILSRIFPFTPRPTLSHLLATIIAQQFVSAIQVPFFRKTTTASASPFAACHVSTHSLPITATTITTTTTNNKEIDGLPEVIPSKERVRLGFSPSSSSSRPKDSRPPLPGFWRRIETMEWRDRIRSLEASLEERVKFLVRDLVGEVKCEIEARWLDALVGAVSEAVRAGEAIGIAL